MQSVTIIPLNGGFTFNHSLFNKAVHKNDDSKRVGLHYSCLASLCTSFKLRQFAFLSQIYGTSSTTTKRTSIEIALVAI